MLTKKIYIVKFFYKLVLGAFLIPYILMLIFEGVPLFLMELSIGQRMRRGPIGAWTVIHPCLVGIGIASMVVSFFVGLYYNTIVAWCIWYICNSFTVSVKELSILNCCQIKKIMFLNVKTYKTLSDFYTF